MNVNDKISYIMREVYSDPAKARFEQFMERARQIFRPWRLGVEGNVRVDGVREVYQFTLVVHLTDSKRGKTNMEVSFDAADAFIALDPTDGQRLLNDDTLQKVSNGIVANLTDLSGDE